jgi:hypothetical protein
MPACAGHSDVVRIANEEKAHNIRGGHAVLALDISCRPGKLAPQRSFTAEGRVIQPYFPCQSRSLRVFDPRLSHTTMYLSTSLNLLPMLIYPSLGLALALPNLLDRSAPSTTARLNTALVPQFGVTAGAGPDGRGNCLGANAAGAAVKIPCFCPPNRQDFLAQMTIAVQQGSFLGTPISFNNNAADTSVDTNKRRATAALIVLQSFNGTKGVGCPGTSAPDFLIQQQTGKVV